MAEPMSRDDWIAALVRMDPNGVWKDEDSLAEGKTPLTEDEARAAYLSFRHAWPETLADVRAFFTVFSQWIAWHPDHPFSEYVMLETGVRIFNDQQVERLDEAMEQAFAVCWAASVEPYDLAFEIYLSVNPFPEER